jgi:hypothetical protein
VLGVSVGKALNLWRIGVTEVVFICGIRVVPSLFVVAGPLKRLKGKGAHESLECSTSDCAYNACGRSEFSCYPRSICRAFRWPRRRPSHYGKCGYSCPNNLEL